MGKYSLTFTSVIPLSSVSSSHGQEGNQGDETMKKLLPFILILGFMIPIQSAQALGCGQVKTMIKSMGADINFSNAKSAKKMVDAYETAFKNPKCLPTKDLAEMRIAAKDLIVECAKPDSVYKMLFTKPVFEAFCGGFKKLAKYTR
jgi:hypothetical protein